MDKNVKNNKLKTFKADLHIHTPASKCYKGSKDDAEYIRIIEKAKERGLDIIAITDHNSIEGYKKLIEQKETIRNEIKSFKKLKDSNEAKKKIKEDEKILAIFDSILILPGVEFEVNNGVHMLAIFNPETEITTIKDFLKNGGFDDESFGKENDVFSNWSLFNFYDESVNYDCLIFDAHTDSNKGIFNTISEGTTRIHAFTDKALVGIFYKSEKQKNNIRNLFSQPDYSRTNPIAFLKSSDAHEINEIGKDKTFFLLDNLKWTDFKDSFNNPDEYIFTTDPDTKAIINSISNTGKCVFISDIKEDNIDEVAKSLCGLSNSDGGYIVLGADSTDAINGIEIRNEDDFKRIDDLFGRISTKTKIKFLSYNSYSIKEGFCVLVVRVESGDELVDVEDEGVVYYHKNGEIKKLNANQIQQLLNQKIEVRYQQQISEELAVIEKSASAINTYLKSRPILNLFNKKSTFIINYISSLDVQQPTKLTPEQKQKVLDLYKENHNGYFRGNIMFVEKEQNPRLKEAYLRITPPKFYISGVKTISYKKHLYIIPGGAVYYSGSELNYLNNHDYPILKIKVSNKYPIKFLCAFLKSSFFLWYLKNKFGTFKLYPSKFFSYISIPSLHLNNPEEQKLISRVETNVDKIIALENDFLKTNWESIDNIDEHINQHNGKTRSLFKDIDDSIFSLLGLKDEDVMIIKENLRANYIYIPE